MDPPDKPMANPSEEKPPAEDSGAPPEDSGSPPSVPEDIKNPPPDHASPAGDAGEALAPTGDAAPPDAAPPVASSSSGNDPSPSSAPPTAPHVPENEAEARLAGPEPPQAGDNNNNNNRPDEPSPSFGRGPTPPPRSSPPIPTGAPPPPPAGGLRHSPEPSGPPFSGPPPPGSSTGRPSPPSVGGAGPSPPPGGPPVSHSAGMMPPGAPPQEERRMSPSGPSPPPHPGMRASPPQQQPPPATQASPRASPQQMPPSGPSPPPVAGPPVHPPPDGGNPDHGAAAAAPPPPPMRELRVEDALLYLDDVKREFGDRPRIYNEFLEIMKNFKSQEVDTPGVIERVSKLFRGYNNLILGFNKFLPDGYKIGIADIEIFEARHSKAEQEAAAAAAAAAAAGRPPHMGAGPSGYYPGGPSQPPGGAPGHAMPLHGQHPPQKGGPAAAGAPHMQAPPVPQKTGPPPMGAQRAGGPSGAQSFPQPGAPPMGRPGAAKAAPQGPPGFLQEPAGAPGGPQQALPSHPPGPPRAAQPPPPQQHQAVEFDHAISYVTNIKKRFANDPSTYHSFLEILHTYQKEQRGIKEVLEQVAALFADHPDLLKEFTFFLPDAVQEQAKERLHRAAADSEARQAAAMAERGVAYGQMMPLGELRGMPQGRVGMQQLPPGSQKFIDMTRAHQGMPPAEGAVDVSPGQKGLQASRKRPYSPAGREGAAIVPIIPPQPETFVYNSAVERQFFDAAKEALTSYTRDGGQAWAEFLKCIDMYAQEILSRSEMLNFVEPLLGKRNAELFEEFKRILTATGSQSAPAPSMEDSWYSVPLAEIDFSRCRRCSPSYRALPRDYPAPPCSERSDAEAKVLNDVWVSLPVGSEESYTFRHMRRNQYEEVLFRCEDERFEIDMVIDSNAATLCRLEPVAEEIAQLGRGELVTPELASSGSGTRLSSGAAGMGGKRYQYTFDDKRILGVIHRNSIARIYGDAGQEMLELINKNPTVAIPVVVQRLRQKDREWRAVRDRMNRQWKDLAELNYYKSLDNRALTWRTIDKRATSTRTLVAEIKDRALHGGNEGDVAIAARLDKAKEEHGSFYEVTMRHRLTEKLDLTDLPKPDSDLFTPHQSLVYENNSWAQRDAYRIMTFALERGATSPNDKERCHRLWRDFLGPWFDLDLNWMQRPALDYHYRASSASNNEEESTPIIVSNGDDNDVQEDFDDDESSSGDENELEKNIVAEELREVRAAANQEEAAEEVNDDAPKTLMDHHPLPAGARVSTVYGEGRVVQFRRSDQMYVVALPFGGATGYLQPNAVLCSVLSAEKSGYTMQLRSEDPKTLERPDDVLCIGTQSLFLFFRLHQILIRRLNIAKKAAYNLAHDKTLSTLVEQMTTDSNEDLGRKRYDAFLSLVYALLEGGCHSGSTTAGAAEGGKYEDRVRCLLGHGAYELATMDKLISHLLKNLQNMGSDETMHNLVQLFRRHRDAGSFKANAFRQEAAYLSDGENMFAFQYSKIPDSDKSVLHMEFLGVIADIEDEDEEDEEGGVPKTAAANNNNNTSAAADVVMADVVSEQHNNSTAGPQPASKRQRRAYRD